MRVMIWMMLAIWWPICAAAHGGVPFLAENAEASHGTPSLDEGIDTLSASLTKEIAARYFHAEKKPVIKVAVFDFTNHAGDVTVGTRYVSNRIRLGFGNNPQFSICLPQTPSEKEIICGAEEFERHRSLRERLVGEMKADVYVFGRVSISDAASMVCEVNLWGVMPPFDNYNNIKNLRKVEDNEWAVGEQALSPMVWRTGLTSSGLDFFTQVLVSRSAEEGLGLQENLGEVIFLSQPMCDDLNLAWQVRADGMVYDVRKESDAGSLRSRTGQIMQSRVKGLETLKELSYIIKNVGLVIREKHGSARQLEFYMVPKKSPFYFIPYEAGEAGLRFMYLWADRGLSKSASSHESGKGWKLHVAEQDYRVLMPVGTHTATATIEPVAESEYGTKKPRSEYVSRFKFAVYPGLNVYVINYVYRRDRPEIFVRRLEIKGSRDVPIEAVKRITEVYRVYGE